VVAFGAFPTGVQALLVVLAVFLEAVLLYVGYGYVEDQFAPAVIETIQSV
jgi:hypothetical protein